MRAISRTDTSQNKVNKYVDDTLMEMVAPIVTSREDIYDDNLINKLSEIIRYLEDNYYLHEVSAEEVALNACYDYLINDIMPNIFEDMFIRSIDCIYNMKDKDYEKYKSHIVRYKLAKDSDNNIVCRMSDLSSSRPNLACTNLFNIYMYEVEQEDSIKKLSENQVFVMLRCRKLYRPTESGTEIIATLLYLNSIKMVRKVKIDSEEYYLISPRGQRYLRTTRKMRKYNVSPFAYPILSKIQR